MIRTLFVLTLIVAAVSAFVTPVNHHAGKLGVLYNNAQEVELVECGLNWFGSRWNLGEGGGSRIYRYLDSGTHQHGLYY
jgi:hypothetical protein